MRTVLLLTVSQHALSGGGCIPACTGQVFGCLPNFVAGGKNIHMKIKAVNFSKSKTRNSVSKTYTYYCLQTKFTKVMFLHLSVILFTGGLSRPRPRGDLPRGVSRPRPGGGVQAQACGRCILACTEADTPHQTATAADGTYPAGMHSCY